MHYFYWGLGFHIIGFLFWTLFILFFIRFAIRGRRYRGSCRGANQGSPIDIVKKRYARGDITKEEYEQLIHELY